MYLVTQKNTIYIFTAFAAMLITACFGVKKKSSTNLKDDPRPNIVLILADDLGYSDLGCYGGEIKTPNLDYLAENGIRFRNFYNVSRCCPTRASLLTGQYNHDAGIGEMTTDRNEPGYRGYLTENTVTVAEVLKTAGYRTAMTGKWHVSNTIEQPTAAKQLAWLNHQEGYALFSPIEQYPTSRGFEKYFGTIWGVVDYFDPFSLVSGTTPIKNVPKDYYQTDAINDTTSAYIREFAKEEKPFFIYVAQNAPHWPLHAKPKDIEKYKDTYTVGWDAIRIARYERMVKMGLINPKTTPLSPRLKPELLWDKNPDKEWDARAMAVHAAMIDNMDQGIGRIINTLKETGELDNTIIIFLSDNGASPEDAMRYGPGFDRTSETRDGRKVFFPIHKSVEHLPGSQLVYSSIGERWANVANTPYQLAKEQSYEGGVRTPMIISWPKGLKAKNGSYSDQIGHVMDFMKTFTDVSKATYPNVYKGNTISPTTGNSLLPAIEGNQTYGHHLLFNEHYNARYVRDNGWKLVSLSNDATWHLYKIDDDETELNDLADKYPEKVKEMKAKWKKWAHENKVLPKR